MSNQNNIRRLIQLKNTIGYDNLSESERLAFDTAWHAQQIELSRVSDSADRDRGQAANLLINALSEKAALLHRNVKHADTVAMIVAFTTYLIEQTPAARIHLDKIIGEIKAAIEDYYKALNRREHGGNAAHHALGSIQIALDMSWDGYNKANVLGNYAILAKEAEDHDLSN